jgi:protein SCO1
MRGHTGRQIRSISMAGAILAVVVLFAGLTGCSASNQEQTQGPRRYAMKGRVVSIDKAQKEVTVDHGDIPGFMGAMTMPYPVKNAALLDALAPGDEITADVVAADSEVWLENFVVTKKADQTGATSPSDSVSSPPQQTK